MTQSGGMTAEGATGGVEMERKLEDVEKGLTALSNEFARLAGESSVADKRLRVLEESVGRHEQTLIQLKETSIEMKMQYSNIMGKFDSLETRIFSLLSDGRKDNAQTTKMWMELFRWVLGGTVMAIIGYLFLGGGR